jgi:hypothetical protein
MPVGGRDRLRVCFFLADPTTGRVWVFWVDRQRGTLGRDWSEPMRREVVDPSHLPPFV